MKVSAICFLLCITTGLLACHDKSLKPTSTVEANQPAQSTTVNKAIQANCGTVPPIQDIHKLEPILIKQGLITENMTLEEKEQALRDYINRKNQTFNLCKKGKN